MRIKDTFYIKEYVPSKPELHKILATLAFLARRLISCFLNSSGALELTIGDGSSNCEQVSE